MREWYDSNSPVWWNTVGLVRSFSSFLSVTTSSNAIWAGEPALIHLVLFWSFLLNAGCSQLLKSLKCDRDFQLCLLTICCNIDNHFSLRTFAFSFHVAAHHHKRLVILWIHFIKSSHVFLFAFSISFLSPIYSSAIHRIGGWCLDTESSFLERLLHVGLL